MAQKIIHIGPWNAGTGDVLPEAFEDVNDNFTELYNREAEKGDTGYTGSHGTQGLIGYTGSFGYTGSQGAGFTGSQGDQGSLGYTGSFGEIGFTGSRGTTGYAGSIGGLGFTGSIGPDGSIGFTGSQGTAGYHGSVGDQGPLGFTGSQGVGQQGVRGFTGSSGQDGFQGNLGYTGSQGQQGQTGGLGARGYSGSVGFTGSHGTTGSDGPRGFTGSQGFNGGLGFTGSVGNQGIQGVRGYSGSVGFVGSRGATGFAGSAGAGYTGSQGTSGSQGPRGYSGSQGDNIFTDNGVNVWLPGNRSLGLGTNTPKTNFHIVGNMTISGGSPAISPNLYWDSSAWRHIQAGAYGSMFQSRATGGFLFRVATSAGTADGTATIQSVLTADSNSNIAVGGFDPKTRLDVQGSLLVRGFNRLVFNDFTDVTNHGGFIAQGSGGATLDIVSGFNSTDNGGLGTDGIRFALATTSTWVARMQMGNDNLKPLQNNFMELGQSNLRWKQAWFNDLELLPASNINPFNNGGVVLQRENNFKISLKQKGGDGVVREVKLPVTPDGYSIGPDVRSFNALGNGSTADNTAFNGMASEMGYIRVPSGSFALNSISINVPIYFDPGAKLVALSGQTITINDVLESPRQHIFTGAGTYNCVNAIVDVIHPRWFGATGNGTTDDTTALQRAINMATSKGTVLLEGNCIYSVSNITLPDSTPFTPTPLPKQWIKGEGNAIIRARSGGSTRYMVACNRWVTNNAYPTRGWGFEGVVFDGNGIKDHALIGKFYAGYWNNCTFMGGTQADLQITRRNSNNSDGHNNSYLSDNQIFFCRFRTSGITGFKTEGTVTAPKESATDGHLVGCTFDGLVNTSEINIDLATANGWFIRGNHSYGASVASIRVRNMQMVGAWADNIWAHGVIIDDVCAYTSKTVTLGPGNKYWSSVTINFRTDNTTEFLLFRGESFEFDHENPSHLAQVITNTNWSNKRVDIIQCDFNNSTPAVKQGSGGTITYRQCYVNNVYST